MAHRSFIKSNMSFLERFARRATVWTGSSAAFALAVLVILAWGITGPIFQFSDTWQLVINTGTTIVTFLMVFLIQRAQNKDSLAVHLKLNEIVAAVEGASNRLINVEELPEDEVAVLKRYYNRLVELARRDEKLTECHSIEEAAQRHMTKRGQRLTMLPRERMTAMEAAVMPETGTSNGPPSPPNSEKRHGK